MTKRRLEKITCWYIVFYAVYSISTRFMPTAVLCEGAPADILYKAVILGAGALALADIIILAKTVRPDRFIILLTTFTLILGLSTVLNHEYEFVGNVLGTATFVCQLIVFYFLARSMSRDMIGACMARTALFTSLFWTPGCAISLYQYIHNIHYTARNPEGRIVRQGITDGRLFGLFSDPNFAAFTSLLIIVLLLYAVRRGTQIHRSGDASPNGCPPFSASTPLGGRLAKRVHTIFCFYAAVCIAVNLAYLIMSNSRTIYIAAVGTILFFVLLRTYRAHRQAGDVNRGKFLCDLAKKTTLTVAAIAAVYAIIFFPIRGIGYAVVPDRDLNDMIREDVNLENITNNRSTIWQNYLVLYTDKPIFGFSVRSALPYATATHPDSYLAKTQYVTHNSYLSLLIETGFTGFAVMGAFFLLIFAQSLKRVQKKEAVSDCYVLFASLTAAVLIFMLGFHDIFFTVNFETMLLFIGIGYIREENEPSFLLPEMNTA